MPTRLNPYLSFRDNAREAMEFYKSVFGGELNVNTFADFNASQDPSESDKVMHSQLEAPNSILLMGADTPNSMEFQEGSNGSISLSGDDESELRGYYDKLSADGTVMMPLDKASWGDFFGMCMDRFGVRWLVNISSAESAAG
jgi:PhnB protein